MRLVCPNCGAQYEVPLDVVPTEGRDVQCSNCGITWFQRHPDDTSQDDEDFDLERADPADIDGDQHADTHDVATDPHGRDASADHGPDTGDDAVRDDAHGGDPDYDPDENDDDGWKDLDVDTDSGSARDFDDDADDGWGDDADDQDYPDMPDVDMPEPPATDEPRRRQLDPDVQTILREEAALARSPEAEALESQPDLGLSDPETATQRRERESREHMAKLRGLPVAAAAATAAGAAIAGADDGDDAAGGSRRDLLPDIEEINSSLRSKGETVQTETEVEETDVGSQRRGFRTGCGLVMLLTAVLILIYLKADWITNTFPALKAPMDSYVEAANVLRAWLDDQVARLLVWLNGMSEGS